MSLVARLVAVSATALCVAGMALGDIDVPFAWQAWRLVTSMFHLRGKPGTWRHVPAFGLASLALVALVALVALGWLWWRAW